MNRSNLAVAVIGAGAMGCLFGGLLREGGLAQRLRIYSRSDSGNSFRSFPRKRVSILRSKSS